MIDDDEQIDMIENWTYWCRYFKMRTKPKITENFLKTYFNVLIFYARIADWIARWLTYLQELI